MQGEYQFSVVAYTSKGPGETASLMISTLPDNSKLIIVTINYVHKQKFKSLKGE